jgi:hypothetical protein
MSATETLVHLRALLADDCDASRRAFYNAAKTLALVAVLVDEFPTLVPPCTEVGGESATIDAVGDRPGDVCSSCPFCGELIALNDREQRVSHVEPICGRFDSDVRKQPSYVAAVEWIKARQVSA